MLFIRDCRLALVFAAVLTTNCGPQEPPNCGPKLYCAPTEYCCHPDQNLNPDSTYTVCYESELVCDQHTTP